MARRTKLEADQTRALIVCTARELFGTNGYAATSVGDIAAACGVTHGALYHHFSSKQDLFREVFRQLSRELDGSVREAALAHADTWGAFVAGCTAVLERMQAPEYQRIALVDGPAALGMREWRQIDREMGLETLTFGVTMLREEGHLPADVDVDGVATILFGGLTEAGIRLSDPNPGVTLTQCVRAVVSIVEALGSSRGRGRRPGSSSPRG